MDFAKQLFAHYRNVAKTIRETQSLYYIAYDASPDIFAEKALEWSTKAISANNPIDREIFSALKSMQIKLGLGHSAKGIRNIVISQTYIGSGFFVFAVNYRNNIAIYNPQSNLVNAETIAHRLNTVFQQEFNTQLTLAKAPHSFLDELDSRIDEAEDYYLTQHGFWTQQFIDALGDNISKLSFRTFLTQRIEAYLKWHSPAIYPIEPPVETAEWRKKRRATPPNLPILEHCSQGARDFFYLHSFIYEQYGIQGVVEAKAGNVVVDAGAFIGDTALYFSQKIGDAGKVYAFEAMPENVVAAQDNLKLNDVYNVEMVCAALSDTEGTLMFKLNEISPSSSVQCQNGNRKVQCLTLDSFCNSHQVKVDFIKSDIEGGEMALLSGAQNTIKRDRPVCAIALYHKMGDFHEIPKFLKKLNPKYKFYFRCEAEPVIFAINE